MDQVSLLSLAIVCCRADPSLIGSAGSAERISFISLSARAVAEPSLISRNPLSPPGLNQRSTCWMAVMTSSNNHCSFSQSCFLPDESALKTDWIVAPIKLTIAAFCLVP